MIELNAPPPILNGGNTDCSYRFLTVNNQSNSLVMLKSIPDILPLLIIEPTFILLGCQKW